MEIPPDDFCCERYASYWNAFLLYIFLLKVIHKFCTKCNRTECKMTLHSKTNCKCIFLKQLVLFKSSIMVVSKLQILQTVQVWMKMECAQWTLHYSIVVHNLLGYAVVICTEDNTWNPPLGTCTPGNYICLTSLTRAKCGTHSTLCWKIPNISGSIELFAL